MQLASIPQDPVDAEHQANLVRLRAEREHDRGDFLAVGRRIFDKL